MGKLIKRKGSKVIWEIWAEDKDSVSVMQHNRVRPMSRIITRANLDKYWGETE